MSAPDRFADDWAIVPDLGRIQHLPHKPNTDRGDLVASAEEASIIFTATSRCLGNDARFGTCVVEEKIDGSQVAIAWDGGDNSAPVIRNKNHVLVKGYGRKNTPAKAQYAPLWNWVYERAKCFAELHRIWGAPVGVHGEWIFAEHTLRYDLAPDNFIAYEVYASDVREFLDPELRARASLHMAGFSLPIILAREVASYAELEALANQPSAWSSRDRREGVIVKVGDGDRCLARFKMRRESFKPREDFNDTPLRRRTSNR